MTVAQNGLKVKDIDDEHAGLLFTRTQTSKHWYSSSMFVTAIHADVTVTKHAVLNSCQREERKIVNNSFNAVLCQLSIIKIAVKLMSR